MPGTYDEWCGLKVGTASAIVRREGVQRPRERITDVDAIYGGAGDLARRVIGLK
jgi:hypothetical protein